MIRPLLTALTLGLGAENIAYADLQRELISDPEYKPASVDCVIAAAIKQKVPANLLLAIASIESGKNGQFVKNKDGSSDIGHFQINSIHWDKKGVFAPYPQITQKEVAWRGCYNAELAAWLLKSRLNSKHSNDFWTRAAAYHSWTPEYNEIYKKKLIPLSIKWGEWLQKRDETVAITFK